MVERFLIPKNLSSEDSLRRDLFTQHFSHISGLKEVEIGLKEQPVSGGGENNNTTDYLPRSLMGAIIILNRNHETKPNSHNVKQIVLVSLDLNDSGIKQYKQDLMKKLGLKEEDFGVVNGSINFFRPAATCNLLNREPYPLVFARDNKCAQQIFKRMNSLRNKLNGDGLEPTVHDSASKPRDPEDPDYYN